MDLRAWPRTMPCDRAVNMMCSPPLRPGPLTTNCPHLQPNSEVDTTDETRKNRSDQSAEVKKILREHIMSRHPNLERAPPVDRAVFRVPVSDASTGRRTVRRTVSEPILKWKLKKMRSNPLQRKSSAPPAVRHRADTGLESSVSESSSCDSLLNDSATTLSHETTRVLPSPKNSPNITLGLPAQAGPPSLTHFSPLLVPLDVGTARRLQPVLILDQSTGFLHQHCVALPPQRPLSVGLTLGSHGLLKRTRSEPLPCSALSLPHTPHHFWTQSGALERYQAKELRTQEQTRSIPGPDSNLGSVWSRRPSVDSVYGTESNTSSRDSLTEAVHTSQGPCAHQLWSHLPVIRTQSSPSSTTVNVPLRFTTGLVYDPQMQRHRCRCSDSSRHNERPERTESIWNRLNQSGLRRQCELVRSRKATLKELQSVHSQNYVMTFGSDLQDHERLGTDSVTEILSRRLLILLPCGGTGVDIDTIWNELHTSTAARVAAGSVTDLALKVALGELQNGFALVRPPGHHATHSSPLGFCYFNSVAIAAKQVLQKLNLNKILILDWDVHHGNGTQDAFYSDPRVLYMSLHRYDQGGFFPGSGHPDEVGAGAGEGFNVNVAWTGGLDPPMGDAEYLAAFRAVVMPIAHEFSPDLVLVSAGFDAAEGNPDELGGYKVSAKCFGFLTRQLMSVAGGRMVLVLEGGHQVQSLCDSAEACVRALLGHEMEPLPSCVLERKPCANAVQSLQSVVHVQSEYWSSLLDTSSSLSMSYSEGQRSRIHRDLDSETVQAIAALSVHPLHSDRRQDSGEESM
uniref:Histone deacetylase n=1 Tax=Knipowitschia caucasica TaxID=637954 RepID=A0AAV2M4Q9_KNICA